VDRKKKPLGRGPIGAAPKREGKLDLRKARGRTEGDKKVWKGRRKKNAKKKEHELEKKERREGKRRR